MISIASISRFGLFEQLDAATVAAGSLAVSELQNCNARSSFQEDLASFFDGDNLELWRFMKAKTATLALVRV
jgi:chromosome condensin MukBEF MukE localization factor